MVHNNTYIVTVTDDNGCQDTALITINYSSYNSILDAQFIRIYPNPAQNYTNIEIELPETKTVGLKLYTVTGQLILQIPSKEMQYKIIDLPIQDFTPGMYFIELQIDQERSSHKLIIKK